MLLSVNRVATALLTARDLKRILGADLESFEVICKLTYDANHQEDSAARPHIQSKEQLSVHIHGFYARGTLY